MQFKRVYDLKDEYITLKGEENPPQYSRITEESKTRIDIMASNWDGCTGIEYRDMAMRTMDHCMLIAEYALDLRKKTKTKSSSLKHEGWCFPNELLEDTDFI